MNAASITIPEDAIAAIVSKAILDGISPEHRDVVMQQAVASILKTPERERYSQTAPQSALQDAFDIAARRAVNTAVKSFIDNHPEFQARVDAAITDQMRQLLDGDYDFSQAVVEALVEAVVRRNR